MSKKILTVVGVRPELTKMGPVSKALKEKGLKEVVVYTGQHYDPELYTSLLKDLGLDKPNYDIKARSSQVGIMLRGPKGNNGLEDIVEEEKPDLVLVYGDTNSTLAGGIVAVEYQIPLAHVEAGMRNDFSLMVEEKNRKAIDDWSNLLFAPTEHAVENLKRENITKGVYFTGDVMLDNFLKNKSLAEKSDILDQFDLKDKEYILLTVHRAENTNNKETLEKIFDAVIDSKEKIVLPLHPRTKKYLDQYNLMDKVQKNIKILPSLKYSDMIRLELGAKKIITDSGGLQKEAYWAGAPCITLVERSAWVTTVEAGWNVLVGNDKEKILNAIKYFEPKTKRDLSKFGDGSAGEHIANIIYNTLLSKTF